MLTSLNKHRFHAFCPLFCLSLLAWRWKQRAKDSRSNSSITRSSWQPCCPRTHLIRFTALLPPSRRKRWRTRTMPWSFWVTSHVPCIHIYFTQIVLTCSAVNHFWRSLRLVRCLQVYDAFLCVPADAPFGVRERHLFSYPLTDTEQLAAFNLNVCGWMCAPVSWLIPHWQDD